ncbi:hypothetical protein ISCGN_028441 [Ixodes scapularis]
MARNAASMNSPPPVSDARKVTEKKAAADAQRQEEAAQKAADTAVFDDQSKCFQLLELVQYYPWLYGKLRRDDEDNPKRENVSEEIARLFDIVRCLRLQEHQKASPALKLEKLKILSGSGRARAVSLPGRVGPGLEIPARAVLYSIMQPVTWMHRSILVFKLLPRCWVNREAKGRRLLLNRLLASGEEAKKKKNVRQMADVVFINPHPVFLNREKGPKREYSAADGYHVCRIFGVHKVSKLIKLQVRKKLGAQ